MPIIDLTHEFRPGAPMAPSLPPVEMEPIRRIGEHGAHSNISFCRFASHAGTHLDAPMHFVPGGRELRDIPLDWLCGDASIVHVPCGEGEAVTADVLTAAGKHVRAGDRVFVRTGFADRYFDDGYFRHAYLTADAAEWLLEREVRLLAVDLVTPEKPHYLRGDEAFHWPVHNRLLISDVLIVENVNLQADLPERFDVTILPLPLSCGDGAPARIVARC